MRRRVRRGSRYWSPGTPYYDPDGLGGAAAIALATFGGAKPILSAGDFILAA